MLPSYKITHYITLSPKFTGLLYPVFSLAPHNIPYVQQIDEDYRIAEFVEALDLEHFFSVSSETRKEFRVGDYCPLAYFDHSGSLIEADLDEMRIGFAGLEENVLVHIGSLPTLTRVHIARVLQRPIGEQTIIWREFANRYIRDEQARQIYLHSQMKTSGSEKQIWDGIKMSTRVSSATFNQDAFFGEMDLTRLRLWLTQNRNDFRFPYGWLRLDKLSRPDEQLLELGSGWFLSRYSELKELSGAAIAIFARLLDLYQAFKIDRDFAEFSIDSYLQGDIFRYVPPLRERTVFDFFVSLSSNDGLQFDRVEAIANILSSNNLTATLSGLFLGELYFSGKYGRREIAPPVREQINKLLRHSVHIEGIRHVEEFDGLVERVLTIQEEMGRD
ncbi:hypothetical protein C7U92_20815 [Bradyrhizobium sp. WBOS7]|uniref:Uncharacterized protein n=1 Tax=Bradyrhizobium betae TaxID=244734 RepID=A0AAE9N7H5_9BRAD|nr:MULTISPECIES: hypothetical protein [Bradyrhizobium]MDD1572888.1 hypothetical protein [Bradyrhizobium sp. WBOS1]UUO33244.1 hypothetical protein DCK84_00710 [Bradyrhizobium sp. WBOS01]MDD1529505.1 hypothetical protein [Bradyrhizobium sp. WBOS2]MDD1579139.1 hypothetical protein [Bradyrhizobium sp. WBOS7]MDD1601946.1 hypothetical protein [Bradyrhizobium sp. WBOS16]